MSFSSAADDFCPFDDGAGLALSFFGSSFGGFRFSLAFIGFAVRFEGAFGAVESFLAEDGAALPVLLSLRANFGGDFFGPVDPDLAVFRNGRTAEAEGFRGPIDERRLVSSCLVVGDASTVFFGAGILGLRSVFMVIVPLKRGKYMHQSNIKYLHRKAILNTRINDVGVDVTTGTKRLGVR